ncbi:DNA primase [Alteribacillus sp. YIM 98480]|uniref:DNA primase n=1 Tax=Alteribacillus sp. YIM 98480 TaxID=2606599 RepID=UPI00131E5EC0|nr:DNA primase [Alteribacillus sp. YIM 98480]
MNKKVLYTAASALMAIGVLTACGGEAEEEEPVMDEEPAEDAGTDLNEDTEQGEEETDTEENMEDSDSEEESTEEDSEEETEEGA